MAPQKHSDGYHRLEMTVTQVQRRWGPRALRRLSRVEAAIPPPALPTGFASLDAATGIGGFPRGQITELLGPATSGKTSLALIALANAQRCGGIVAYFDPEQVLDPDYARRCGLDLHRLLIVHPPDSLEALAIAAGLARRQGLQLMAFASGPEFWLPAGHLALDLHLLSQALAATPCVALFLTTNDCSPAISPTLDDPGWLGECAALRLSIAHERWIRRPWEDVTGYVAVVVVGKNKLAAPGRQAVISITFNGAVRGHSRLWEDEKP